MNGPAWSRAIWLDVRYSGGACIARLGALPAKHRLAENTLASVAAAAN
jgi:hypothetical protein